MVSNFGLNLPYFNYHILFWPSKCHVTRMARTYDPKFGYCFLKGPSTTVLNACIVITSIQYKCQTEGKITFSVGALRYLPRMLDTEDDYSDKCQHDIFMLLWQTRANGIYGKTYMEVLRPNIFCVEYILMACSLKENAGHQSQHESYQSPNEKILYIISHSNLRHRLLSSINCAISKCLGSPKRQNQI